MLLIDHARDVIGLPVNGLHVGRHCGWTTDGEKAAALAKAGANVVTVHAGILGPVSATDNPGRIIGYDISFAVGREVQELIAA